MEIGAIPIPDEHIQSFCQRWHIDEFAVFGSVLNDGFGPQSDIDVMISFSSGANWGLFDHVAMKLELEELLDREVDLVTRRAVEQRKNWIRREGILNSAQVLYPPRAVSHAT